MVVSNATVAIPSSNSMLLKVQMTKDLRLIVLEIKKALADAGNSRKDSLVGLGTSKGSNS